MTTSLGTLLIELEATKAPVTVKNFLAYVQDGFYANTVFHRIISTFMAQGGGFTFGTTYAAKAPTRAAIALERTSTTGLSNTARTIAMARTSAPDSATSQFFINLVDNPFLNAQGSSDGNGYAVFGTVITTADVNSDATLAALRAVPVVNNGAGEVSLPTSPPVVTAVTRVR
jgi:peptidyl-prolyl cis-trans isomerase A (cyclophilin A)